MTVKSGKIIAAISLAVLAGAGLSACMQGGPKETAFETRTAPSGYGLFYMDEGDAAKLAYGVPNSDTVLVMMRCRKGTGSVELTDAVKSVPSPTLTLVSNGQQTTLKTETQSFEGTDFLVAHTTSGAAPLQAFRRSGRIDVAYAGQKHEVAAAPEERPGVESFFTACGTGRAA